MSITSSVTQNKVDVSDVGPSRKKLRIEIPASAVADSLGTSLEALTADAELPGFRRGHVPKRLIEKKFGAGIRKQAKEQLVAQAFQAACDEKKLRVVGAPVDSTLEKLELVDGKPFIFEVEVEVAPEFELPNLEGIKVRKPLAEVTDDLLAAEVKKLCVQEGSLEERQSAEPGDYVTGHAKLAGTDGKVYFESDGIVVQVPPADKAPKGMIVGLVVDDLSTQLGTLAAGKQVTIKTKGPENHETEAMRGKDLVIEYTPARIDRIIPADIKEVCARFGLADEDAIKNALRSRLYQRVQIEQAMVMRQQVTKHLLDHTTMEVPERLTASQSQRYLERRRSEMMYRGMDPVAIEEAVAAARAASAADAVRDLKLFFLLDRAAEKLGVRVTESEVNGRIAAMAQERNERPEKLRQALINSNQISTLFTQIREHKTVDAILAKAEVTEMKIEDYRKALEEESKAKK